MGRPRQRPAAVFADRRDAGRRLGELLYAGERALVVALPRGGVPVGFEVASSLGLALDVLAVRKLGAPGNPELAVGAIAEGGARVLEPRIADRAGVTKESLEQIVARETLELRRQAELFRGSRPPLDPLGRRVIAVDDGLATGLTMLAAVEALRERDAASITVAVPVGARESLELLRAHADEVVCHTRPEHLLAVGAWYQNFDPVSDEEVMALLRAGELTPRS
ncbi:MAG TPA: phosphoribosyltransferase family protein [Solirubrobacteraceae bacterium]